MGSHLAEADDNCWATKGVGSIIMMLRQALIGRIPFILYNIYVAFSIMSIGFCLADPFPLE